MLVALCDMNKLRGERFIPGPMSLDNMLGHLRHVAGEILHLAVFGKQRRRGGKTEDPKINSPSDLSSDKLHLQNFTT